MTRALLVALACMVGGCAAVPSDTQSPGPSRRVWTHDETGNLVTDVVGPAHCGWESARLLHITDGGNVVGTQYVRDPLGVLGQAGKLETYADDVDLPADATFSGYRSDDGLELWLTPENRAAYVVRRTASSSAGRGPQSRSAAHDARGYSPIRPWTSALIASTSGSRT